IAQSFGQTLRYTISDEKVEQFVNKSLQLLFVFKDHLVKEAARLQSRLMEEYSAFGS
ncbi:MAG: hypothetical protein EXX96DRAFT_484687, partial [Benjaminiella poitrasii]